SRSKKRVRSCAVLSEISRLAPSGSLIRWICSRFVVFPDWGGPEETTLALRVRSLKLNWTMVFEPGDYSMATRPASPHGRPLQSARLDARGDPPLESSFASWAGIGPRGRSSRHGSAV